jgi:hypothetical protein
VFAFDVLVVAVTADIVVGDRLAQTMLTSITDDYTNSYRLYTIHIRRSWEPMQSAVQNNKRVRI